ncbi:MAG TPA: V-type ATPase subunit [bacterium]|nr:V-type ATPase subunit [bacterium]HOL66761.1 V-type ATPase subunit [bacterium]HPP12561.1 V-type ATPase subunit [bacterium]
MSDTLLTESARVKSLEKTFLSREVLERLASAASLPVALAELEPTCYRFPQHHPDIKELTEFFERHRLALLALAGEILPAEVFRWFCFRYDLENLRLVLNVGRQPLQEKAISPFSLLGGEKFRGQGENPSFPMPELSSLLLKEASRQTPEAAARASQEFFHLWQKMTVSLQNSFLLRYLALEIDFFNLSLFLWKQTSGESFDWKNLVSGGRVCPENYQELSRLWSVFQKNYRGLKTPVTAETWEREYVAAAIRLLKEVRVVAYGVEVLVGYLLAREIEISGLQKLLLGKAYGLPVEVLREWIYPVYG